MEYVSDYLVVGSGVAGLLYALKVANSGRVHIITKRNIEESNTAYAQGGIASVFGREDTFDSHIADTLTSGDGLCHESVVEMVVQNAPARIRELMKLGVDFNTDDTQESGLHLDLSREGGHSQNRIVHAADLTGLAVEKALIEKVRRHENIEVFENHIAVDLITRSTRLKRGQVITTHEDYCYGAYVLERRSLQIHTFCAKTILLATGGAGKVYAYTSNPDIASGDGIAMAYRAGAVVANMEFVQFHPTCLFHPEAKNFLISEAVRGEGGVLLNTAGDRFMERYTPLKELACRDVVARAIDSELKKRGDDSVFLDISHKPADSIRSRFPHLYKKCLEFGIDMTTDPIPVVPAAHYMCGGVVTDIYGQTNIQRLFAIGETACTGLHGANRLASNSLLEALTYAHQAAQKSTDDLENSQFRKLPEIPPWDDLGTLDSDEAILVSHTWDEIRRFMWNYVGIVRSDKRLARAQRRIEIVQSEIEEYYWNFKITPDMIELRNIAIVAELIIRCAKHRKESRGLHYNIAYPDKNDIRWKKDTVLRRPFVS
ncbi:MAG TPA: L-aspartate oxidase [Desulfosalsimonadaceae bacterium]|nr:L-aspartate oxidase [Desulfosalsimonadaceae bacterium]